MERIFVVDDEANIRNLIQEALEGESFEVKTFSNPLKAIAAIEAEKPRLVITDLRMPEMNGVDLIKKAKSIHPELSIVLVTAYASLDSAIEAIRFGASDYLIKPFKIDDLLKSVHKSLSQKRLIPETNKEKKTSAHNTKYLLKNLIGQTEEMKNIFKLMGKVSPTDSSVLIMGESGTGKEMVARAIHYESKRKNGPFVSINCAALPETLLESELFGYEKGAFTGAAGTKVGLFELSEKGTFLLDEVGDMPVSLQVKLLRVLQERSLKRLGGIKEIAVDFRLIAATSKNLSQAIKEGKFREDLFYRLNVIPIVIPALRNRTPDIVKFIEHYIKLFNEKQKPPKQFKLTPAALKVFQDYAWPGNIRELENVVERMLTLAEHESVDEKTAAFALNAGHLSSATSRTINDATRLKENMDTYEREMIEDALKSSQGNKNKAAKKLNLTRQALHYKLKKLNIQAND